MGEADPNRIVVDFNVDDSRSSLVALLERLDGAWEEPRTVRLDLADCDYLGPVGVLTLCGLQDRRRAAGADTEIVLPHRPALAAYCRYAGLAARFPGGALPDVAHPKSETLAISSFSAFDARILNAVTGLVRRHMDLGRGAEEALKTSLSEIMYNVLDHAASPVGGLLTARAFENRREVRVAIADIGVGVLATLSRTLPQLTRHDEALREALRGDSSARSTARNLGQGLKTLDRIAQRNGGQLLIASYEAVYTRDGGAAQVRGLRPRFPGTLVSLRFKVDNELYAGDDGDDDVW